MIRSKRQLGSLIAVLFSVPAFAQLSLSPEEIEVNDVLQSKKILITYAGQPVMPDEITKIVSGVTKTGDAVPETAPGNTHFSDYSFMFDFTTGEDGIITLKPNKGLLEIGTYDLIVYTIHGIVTGSINANLRDSIPPTPHRPVRMSEFSYDIDLQDRSYGQVISIDLKPDQKNTYSWFIDGVIHSSGLAETSFRAWPETGVHEISFIAQSPDGQVVSKWSDTIKVSDEDPIATTVRKGYEVPFSAPAGYSQVTWSLDGKVIADNQLDRQVNDTQVVQFRSKGKHVLTCFARGSETGDFRRITWSVNVK